MAEGRDRAMRRTDQRGQSLVLVVISLTVLLGMAALVLDLGLGWYAKRQLQASVDAAALAGAQELPSSANAIARAHEYILKNPTRGVDGVQDTTITKCIASAPGCAPVNAVQVTAKRQRGHRLRAGVRHQLDDHRRQGHRLPAVRREAARHPDRARPHGLDDRGRHAEQARQRAHRHHDLPELPRRGHGPGRPDGAAAVEHGREPLRTRRRTAGTTRPRRPGRSCRCRATSR